jgi:general secretion pathway protein C
VLVKWFWALFSAAATAFALAIFSMQSPANNAGHEEALIFNADYASSFGEDPQPKKRLQLLSIGHDEQGKFAKVKVDGRAQHLRTGISITSCLAVVEVLDDAVLIDNCGSYALLSQASDTMESGLDLKADINSGVSIIAPTIVDLRDNSRVSTLLGDYRDRLYTRPLSLRRAVNVDVRVDSVGERGYYLSPGKDKALFSVLPMQSGDRVVAVNGFSLADGEALTDIYAGIADLSQLALTLERDGQYQVLLVRF